MQTDNSLHQRQSFHFGRLIAELKGRPDVDQRFTAALGTMTFTQLKASRRHSRDLGRLATPEGRTPIYLHFSKIHARTAKGIVGHRTDYLTRCLDDVPGEDMEMAGPGSVASKLDYLERRSKVTKKNSDDVEFVVGNMGATAAARRRTGKLIQEAERSVKEGGMRRRQVQNAVVMGSLIISLPVECDTAQRTTIARKISGYFESKGVFFLAVGHRPSQKGDQRNYHLHLVFSLRPHTVEADGTIKFGEKVDRALQGAKFLRALRERVAEASNEALAAAGAKRRVFAGNYTSAGLPIVRSRTRIGVQAYQRMHSAAEEGSLAMTGGADLVAEIVEHVRRRAVAEALSSRGQRQREKIEARRAALVDGVMRQLLIDGELFVVDRSTGEPAILDARQTRQTVLRSFADLEDVERIGWRLYRVGRLLKTAGAAAKTWLVRNATLAMKGWAHQPQLALEAAAALGGKVSFTPGGALKVTPPGHTWVGNGALSFLADAIRNHAAPQVTAALTGVPTQRDNLRCLPSHRQPGSDSVERYAIALASGRTPSLQSLGLARRYVAKLEKLPLSVETSPAVDKLLRRRLSAYDKAPYLLQQHVRFRETVPADAFHDAGLEPQRARYLGLLQDIESQASERDPAMAENCARACFEWRGAGSWKAALSTDLQTVLSSLPRYQAQLVADRFYRAVRMPDGTLFSREDLGAIANNAFERTPAQFEYRQLQQVAVERREQMVREK